MGEEPAMPMPSPYSDRRRHGTTLLELLAATSIAALIFSVLFAVYFAAIQTAGRQAGGRGAAAAADALDVLARDFMCAMVPANLTNPPFWLAESTNDVPGMICRFYTAEPWSPDSSPRLYAVRAVQVQLLPGPSAGAYILERLSQPLPAAADGTNIIRETWAPIRALAMAAGDGETWSNRWSGDDLPRAVRLKLQHGEAPDQAYAMEIAIPAGIPFGPTNASAPGKQMLPNSTAR